MQSPNASIPPCGAPPSWRAARRCLPTGHAALSAELPDGGWPMGSLVELLSPHPGVGEIRLLRPALSQLETRRPIALVQPPHAPNIVTWMSWRLDPRQLLWVCPEKPADALWAAEQILRNGSCGALLCWLPQVRPESLRRLHLAAQASDLLFVALRPSAAAAHATPAPCGWRWRPRRADCPSISSSAGACLRYAAARGPGARRLRNTRPPCASGSPPACAACRWTPYARTGLTTPRRTPCWSRSA